MSNSLKAIFTVISVAVVLSVSTSPGKTGDPVGNVQVPIPPGTDIRKINHAGDLKPAEISRLIPTANGINYFLGEFRSSRAEGDRKYTKTDMHFVTLLPLDYHLLDRFAFDVLGPDTDIDTIDGLMKKVPNLIKFLESFSAGKIEKKVEKVGQSQKVTLSYVLDEKLFFRKYPAFQVSINKHIKNASLELRDRKGNLYLLFGYSNNRANVAFLLGAKGRFMPMESEGIAPTDSIGIEDARQGVRLYVDVGLKINAMLVKVLRLLIVDVEKVRIQLDIQEDKNKLYAVWKVTDVRLRDVNVAGFDSTPIKDDLLHMKNNLLGTVNFEPIETGGKKYTFMKAYGTGEEIDNWLVRASLVTFASMGAQFFTDLSLPLIELLVAIKSDVSGIPPQ